VCAALEDPSTGPFGEAQDRLRAGTGVDDESCREAAALREALEARTDDRRIVAELLGVPVEVVELVENRGYSWGKENARYMGKCLGVNDAVQCRDRTG